MTYEELKNIMLQHNINHPDNLLKAVIVLTSGRKYLVNSNNPAFKLGTELYGTSMDEDEICIRLDYYIAYNVDYCYLIEGETHE